METKSQSTTDLPYDVAEAIVEAIQHISSRPDYHSEKKEGLIQLLITSFREHAGTNTQRDTDQN